MIPESRSFMPMSSPATYSLGMCLASARAHARRTASLLLAVGSARMPAFAPPKKRSAAVHFHVIVRASRAISSTLTVGLMRVPPLPMPRAVLSITITPCMPVRWSATQTTFSGPHSSIRSNTSFTFALLALSDTDRHGAGLGHDRHVLAGNARVVDRPLDLDRDHRALVQALIGRGLREVGHERLLPAHQVPHVAVEAIGRAPALARVQAVGRELRTERVESGDDPGVDVGA